MSSVRVCEITSLSPWCHLPLLQRICGESQHSHKCNVKTPFFFDSLNASLSADMETSNSDQVQLNFLSSLSISYQFLYLLLELLDDHHAICRCWRISTISKPFLPFGSSENCFYWIMDYIYDDFGLVLRLFWPHFSISATALNFPVIFTCYAGSRRTNIFPQNNFLLFWYECMWWVWSSRLYYLVHLQLCLKCCILL